METLSWTFIRSAKHPDFDPANPEGVVNLFDSALALEQLLKIMISLEELEPDENGEIFRLQRRINARIITFEYRNPDGTTPAKKIEFALLSNFATCTNSEFDCSPHLSSTEQCLAALGKWVGLAAPHRKDEINTLKIKSGDDVLAALQLAPL